MINADHHDWIEFMMINSGNIAKYNEYLYIMSNIQNVTKINLIILSRNIKCLLKFIGVSVKSYSFLLSYTEVYVKKKKYKKTIRVTCQ